MSTKREPEGIPTGGRWATESKAESSVDLASDRATALMERHAAQERLGAVSARAIADRLTAARPDVTSFIYHEDEHADFQPRILNVLAGGKHLSEGEMDDLEDVLQDDSMYSDLPELPTDIEDGPEWARYEGDGTWEVTIADLPRDEPDNSPPAAAKRVRDLMRDKTALQRQVEKESAVMIAATIKQRFPEAASVTLTWDDTMNTYHPDAPVRSAEGEILAKVSDPVFRADPETGYELQDVITNLPEVGSRWSSSAELRAADPERNWIAPGAATGSANLDLTRF